MVVKAPGAWKVVSNAPEIPPDLESKDSETLDFTSLNLIPTAIEHIFEKTPPISTYLFSLVAGNYVEVEPANKDTPVPMKLYACAKNMSHLYK